MNVKEWAEDFKGFINELQMPRDDYKGIMSYINDGLELMKEQEPKTVIKKWNECPSCGKTLDRIHDMHYCGACGQAVKWND